MSVPVGVGPQVNKFEQVSSDGHKMSLAGRGDRTRGGGGLYSEVQFIMSNGPIGTPLSPWTH